MREQLLIITLPSQLYNFAGDTKKYFNKQSQLYCNSLTDAPVVMFINIKEIPGFISEASHIQRLSYR